MSTKQRQRFWLLPGGKEHALDSGTFFLHPNKISSIPKCFEMCFLFHRHNFVVFE